MIAGRTAGLIALAGIAASAGCTGNSARERWQMSDGSAIEITLPGPVQREERDGRVRYRLESGFVVTMQEIARDVRLPNGERTARIVAQALVERVELGEREGELTNHACRAGELDAECVSGWMERQGRRYARSGAIVEVGERIAWIDVAGPDDQREDVTRTARGILDTIHFEPAVDHEAVAQARPH